MPPVSAAEAASQIRFYSAADPNAAADAAWAAADTLHVAAAALGSRALRQAADSFERAARAPYGRLPRPAPAGSRSAAGRPAAGRLGVTSTKTRISYLRLVSRLVALARALAEIRMASIVRASARSSGRIRLQPDGEAAPFRGHRPGDGRSGQPNIRPLQACRHPRTSLKRRRPGGLRRAWHGSAARPHPMPRRLLAPLRCSGRGGPALRVGLPRILSMPGCRAGSRSEADARSPV